LLKLHRCAIRCFVGTTVLLGDHVLEVEKELQEPDFDALRSRAEFQTLLAKVQARSAPKVRSKD
jgi:hypothetical protein